MSDINDILAKFADQIAATAKPDGTSTILVKDLRAIRPTITDPNKLKEIDRMIEKALGMQYDDYKSKSAFPKVDLVRDAEQLGLTQISRNTQLGRYD